MCIRDRVIAIVVEAVLRIAKRTINHYLLVGFAVVAFVALYFLSIPFPLVVLAAAVAGLILSRTSFAGDAFTGGGHGASEEQEDESALDRTASDGRPTMLRNLRLLGTFVLLWALPLGALYLWRGGEDVRSRADFSSSSSEDPCPPPPKASPAKFVRLKRSPATAAARTTRGNGTEKK